MPHGDILSERGSFTIFLANKIPQSNSSSTFFLFLSTQKVLWKFHALLKWLKGMDRVYTYIHRQIHTRAHTHTHIYSFSEESVFMYLRNVTARPSLSGCDRIPLLCSHWWESQAVPMESVSSSLPLGSLSVVFSMSFSPSWTTWMCALSFPGCRVM